MNVTLKYDIYKCSSFSLSYIPENIKHNKPSDQNSRWSSDSNSPPQFVILKLQRPAIVRTVTFGKFEKVHVCNMKKFQVLGGMQEDNMILLLDGSLKNDNVPETFCLKHTIQGHSFACKYVKISPLQSWGQSLFHYSIWYVELTGEEDWQQVEPCINWYNQCREKETLRLCLKHLRQHNFMDVFTLLQKRTKVQLEDPLLTELHNTLVLKGDYEQCTKIMEKISKSGLFTEYINKQIYHPKWKLISTHFTSRPGMRGGHQMCLDSQSGIIYLFGGWDGTQDLADLWMYNIEKNHWQCLSVNTEIEGGPSARSCHKMCLDSHNKHLYLLGRYLDFEHRMQQHHLCNDFYVYNINTHCWTLIAEDTANVGGPPAFYDHQMCLDTEKNTLYVFGGRVLTKNHSEEGDPIYSGLYCYHVPTNTWTKLRDGTYNNNNNDLYSRVGHSMLFHSKYRVLYILSGQRSKKQLNDLIAYYVDTDEIEILWDGNKLDGVQVPSSGSTHRATLDIELNEIYVLSGFSKQKERRSGVHDITFNSLCVYDIAKNKWSCIYCNEANSKKERSCYQEPCPRFAHQFVYNDHTKVHYLFGGNSGKMSLPHMRLDDFWTLSLQRPSQENVLHQCLLLIYKHKFFELTYNDPLEGLQYLQNHFAKIIDHFNPEQVELFHSLAANLFKSKQGIMDDLQPDFIFLNRTQLFDSLVQFFPEDMVQPKTDLLQMVSL